MAERVACPICGESVNSHTIKAHILWKHVLWTNPNFRRKMQKRGSETLKMLWKTPEYRARQQERKRMPKIKVNLADSEDLFYIIGCLKGDGCVGAFKRGNREGGLNFSVILCPGFSEAFANSFIGSASRIGLHPKISRDKKGEIKVVANSKMFVGWYGSLRVSEIEEKLKRSYPFATAFIRGFYEAEGSLYPRKSGRCLAISGVNKGLMEMVFRVLRFWGCKVHLSSYLDKRYSRRQYLIRTSARFEIEKFLKGVNPCIKNGLSSQIHHLNKKGRT